MIKILIKSALIPKKLDSYLKYKYYFLLKEWCLELLNLQVLHQSKSTKAKVDR